MSIYDSHAKLLKKKDDLEARLANLKDEIAASEQRLLDKMGEDGLSKVHTSLCGLRVQRSVRASAGNNMPALVAAFRTAGLDDMVKDTVNGNTLGAWVRELAKAQGNLDEMDLDQIKACLPKEVRDAVNVTETIEIRPFSKLW